MMTRKIFKSIFIVSIAVIISSLIIIIGFLNSYFTNKVRDELKNEAQYVAHAVENIGIDYFTDYDLNGNRITWISKDGSVIFDTDADAKQMENHINREEVSSAFKNGYGFSQRYSSTVLQKTMYYAVRIDNNTVIRVSTKQATILSQIMGMIQPIIIVFIIAVVISAILASKMSKIIVKPINEINLDNPIADSCYEEIYPFIRKIIQQKLKIALQLNELKQNQENFKLITENMNEGIIIADKNANMLSYNQSVLKCFNVSLTKSNHSIYALNRSQNFIECIDNAVNGKKSETTLSLGEMIYKVIANPTVYNGNTEGIFVIILNVTEQEKNEIMRREFTSNVSHELKTPLTSIYGISDMLVNGIVKPDDVKGFGENIRNEAGRLITLINDIIALSKLDEGAFFSETTEIDLYTVCEDVMNRLKIQSDQKNLDMILTGKHISMKGNLTIIDEIVYNICDNAIKYNKNKGYVKCDISEDNGYAIITVEDSGIGVEAQYLDRIFERFFRTDKSHSKKIGGTGLGLSIVKHGVQYHKGTVKAESKLDKGTKITVTLPL